MQSTLRMMAKNLASKLPSASAAVLPCARNFVTARPLLRSSSAAINQFASIQPYHQTSRTFAASAVSRESKALVEAIDEELDHEKTRNTDREILPQPPGDWIATDEPGECIVTLTKKHGEESIMVELNINDQADPADDFIEEGQDGEQEANIDLTITFDATIERDGKAITFELESDGTYLDIQHVAFDSLADIAEDDHYSGPDYSELDERLQKAFGDYLEERGINAELGDYLIAAADGKEQKEYLQWLKGIKGFIRS